MNIICSICRENLIHRDNSFYTECGHVFHYDCLTSWIERSKNCPQCRDGVTLNTIHKLYFTYSTNNVNETHDSTLQQKVDSLKFQMLLKEKDIQYYSSKCVNLEKQNLGLKQEVRKVESEMCKKNSAIYALKEQLNYFKEKNSKCDNLKREIAKLKCKIEDLKPIQMLLHGPHSDVRKMVDNTKDCDTLIKYISIMKKELIASFDKCKQLRMAVKKLQRQHSLDNQKSDTIVGYEIQMNLEEKLTISESKNTALQKRIEELEDILHINEKCNDQSAFQNTKNILDDNREVRPKDFTLNHDTGQKRQEMAAYSPNCLEEVSDTGSTVNDINADFQNSSSSRNSRIVSKRSKPSENSISIGNENISNYTSKKKRKHDVRKVIDETSHGIIDLT